MEERFELIMEHWFMIEPVLFAVASRHKREPNTRMHCALRCGQGRIEYNPSLVAGMSDWTLEEALKVEVIRILLKHPYERKPEGCSNKAIALGSDAVVADNYRIKNLKLDGPKAYNLPDGMNFEWYAWKIQQMMTDASASTQQSNDSNDGPAHASPSNDDGKDAEQLNDDNNDNAGSSKINDSQNSTITWGSSEGDSERSDLWEEDELMNATLNDIIEKAECWGSLSGQLESLIRASTKARIDWRKALGGFRATIINSKRKLTRMRPNRRTGFQNMGSVHQLQTRLLVAVDVSGSISDAEIAHFYSIIDKAFRYGIETIDVVQFDCGIRKTQNLKKVTRDVTVIGRGGTSFQEPIDYAFKQTYDGLVILTDGYAATPQMPPGMRAKTLWVCTDQESFDTNHGWMAQRGRVTMMEL